MNRSYFILILLAFLAFAANVKAQEQVVFNKIWTSTTKSGGRLTDISEVVGAGFKVVSQAATFTDSQVGGSGNNYSVTLYYVNNGTPESIPGVISGVFKNGQTVNGFLFSNTANTRHYVLVVPGREAQFAALDDPGSSSDSPIDNLNTFKTAQQNSVIASIADATTVTESSTATYATFSLVFSKSRTLSSDNVTFTPSITNTSTSSSDFSTGTIQYLNNSTWTDASSGITVAYNVNSVSLRIQIANDTRPEVNETFILNTGAFTGDGGSQIQNSAGTYAVGTIADNNDPLVWTGASNSSWSTAANWTPNDLTPSADYFITVPGSLSTYPNVGSASSIKSLTVESGATLSIANSVSLSVSGNVSNNGQISGLGDLELNGSSAQTISGTGFYRNLKINNASGVTISSGGSNMVNMTGTLTLSAGTLTTNGNLTLKNTSTYAGIIGTVNCGSSTISGNIITERFFPGNRRAFRYISPGVNTTSTINANWQEGVNNTSTGLANNLNPNPNFGTHITGSKTGANGFDATVTGNPSLYTFNATIQSWVSATNTNVQTLKFGMGYKLLIRGSRAVDMSTNTPTPDSTILRTSGEPCLCTTIVNSTGSGTNVNPNVLLGSTNNDFSLVGNPYWAYVNWHSVSRTDIANTYYVWDPNMAGSNNRGAFVSWTYNPSDNTGVKSNNSSDLERYIQPGQAFFVQTTGSTPSLTFNESDKYNTDSGRKNVFSNSTGSEDVVVKSPSIALSSEITILLYLKENLKSQPADGVKLIYGNSWNNSVGIDDALKFNNSDENIALFREGKSLSFEGRALLTNYEKDSVDLKIWNLNPREYALRVDATKFNGSQKLFFVNKKTGTKSAIQPKSVVDINFSPQSSQQELFDYTLVVESAQQSDLLTISSKGFSAYPNPVIDLLNLIWDTGLNNCATASVSLTDTNGQKVFHQQIDASTGSAHLNIAKLTRGVYFLEFICGNKVFRKKIIKS